MLEKKVVQHCRRVVLLYCLELILVGMLIATALEEVGWATVVVVVDVGM
jgi:hypothetical protein